MDCIFLLKSRNLLSFYFFFFLFLFPSSYPCRLWYCIVMNRLLLSPYLQILGAITFQVVNEPAADMQCPIAEMPTRSKLSCLSWNKYKKNYIASSDYEGIVTVWDVTTCQVKFLLHLSAMQICFFFPNNFCFSRGYAKIHS